jgi:hypothetical protein
MNVHFSQQSDEWATPQDVFDKLDAEFGFTIDALHHPKMRKSHASTRGLTTAYQKIGPASASL